MGRTLREKEKEPNDLFSGRSMLGGNNRAADIENLNLSNNPGSVPPARSMCTMLRGIQSPV